MYFNCLKNQFFILVTSGDIIASFVSYICNHKFDAIDVPKRNFYISTICVNPESRRQGLANRLYNELEAKSEDAFIYTRTWNHNASHIHLLINNLMHESGNDRSLGTSSVYYATKMGDTKL